MNFIFHWLGMDNGSSRQYLFWSGFVGDVTIIAAAFGLYRAHNCSVTWCLRARTHPVHTDDGSPTPYRCCRVHHPKVDESVTKVTAERIATFAARHPEVGRGA